MRHWPQRTEGLVVSGIEIDLENVACPAREVVARLACLRAFLLTDELGRCLELWNRSQDTSDVVELIDDEQQRDPGCTLPLSALAIGCVWCASRFGSGHAVASLVRCGTRGAS